MTRCLARLNGRRENWCRSQLTPDAVDTKCCQEYLPKDHIAMGFSWKNRESAAHLHNFNRKTSCHGLLDLLGIPEMNQLVTKKSLQMKFRTKISQLKSSYKDQIKKTKITRPMCTNVIFVWSWHDFGHFPSNKNRRKNHPQFGPCFLPRVFTSQKISSASSPPVMSRSLFWVEKVKPRLGEKCRKTQQLWTQVWTHCSSPKL